VLISLYFLHCSSTRSAFCFLCRSSSHRSELSYHTSIWFLALVFACTEDFIFPSAPWMSRSGLLLLLSCTHSSMSHHHQSDHDFSCDVRRFVMSRPFFLSGAESCGQGLLFPTNFLVHDPTFLLVCSWNPCATEDFSGARPSSLFRFSADHVDFSSSIFIGRISFLAQGP
jgi:hypothetical protein